MSKNITFTNKVSPLIEGQVPDFVQSDHPVFVDFVKDYFEFLEAGRLSIENEVYYVREETNTVNYILNYFDYFCLYGQLVVTHNNLVEMLMLIIYELKNVFVFYF